ncbi:MAG: M56 family metallopeptidase [Kiritimatiellae bacterium]|nr:M56 family metallopeptidase [Kiritimatiellia bacterium]
MNALDFLFGYASVQRVGWALVHSLWQAAIVAIVLAVALRLMRKVSANARYLAACAALVLIVALPIVTLRLVRAREQPVTAPHPRILQQPVALPTGDTPMIVPPLETADTPVALIPVPEPLQTPWFRRLAVRAEALMPGVLPYLVFIWLIGVCGLSLWHLGGWAQLQRLKRRTITPVADALSRRVYALAGALRVRQAVAVFQSAFVPAPAVVGWLKPVILLPASALTGLSAGQLESLLAHELTHFRRCDYLVNMLQTAIEILGFYHPAVWWVSRRIRIERENCCDDVAAGLTGDRAQYASALATMEELRAGPGLAMTASGGSLCSRIQRLAKSDADGHTHSGWVPAMAVVLVAAAVAALGVIPARVKAASGREGVPSAEVASRETTSAKTNSVALEHYRNGWGHLAAVTMTAITDEAERPERYAGHRAVEEPELYQVEWQKVREERKGYLSAAVTAFEQALALQPDSPVFHESLAYAYTRSFDNPIVPLRVNGQSVPVSVLVGKAVTEYRKAIELSPHDSFLRLALSRVYMSQQEYRQAFDELRLVTKQTPDEALFHYEFAAVLYEMAGTYERIDADSVVYAITNASLAAEALAEMREANSKKRFTPYMPPVLRETGEDVPLRQRVCLLGDMQYGERNFVMSRLLHKTSVLEGDYERQGKTREATDACHAVLGTLERFRRLRPMAWPFLVDVLHLEDVWLGLLERLYESSGLQKEAVWAASTRQALQRIKDRYSTWSKQNRDAQASRSQLDRDAVAAPVIQELMKAWPSLDVTHTGQTNTSADRSQSPAIALPPAIEQHASTVTNTTKGVYRLAWER